MEINNKKNYLSHVRVYFIMLLFAVCSTMNVFFCNSYNLYELSNKKTENEMWTISESFVANEASDNNTYVKAPSFLNETITKNISSILMITDIPRGISLLLFLIIVFLFFFLTLFLLLPDRGTLISQKVRLDN